MLYITTNGGDTVLLLLRATTTSSFSTALLELLVRLLFLPHVAEQHRRRSTMGKGQGALGYAATGSHDDHSLTLPPSLAATLVLLALQLSVALSPGQKRFQHVHILGTFLTLAPLSSFYRAQAR